MKKGIVIISLLLTSCQFNIGKDDYLDGCTEGSRRFIEMSIRQALPIEQLRELRKICDTFYEDERISRR